MAGADLEHKGQIRVQWCHGAPGIVATAFDYLPEELLLAGGELTWRAGPHRERGPLGPSLLALVQEARTRYPVIETWD